MGPNVPAGDAAVARRLAAELLEQLSAPTRDQSSGTLRRRIRDDARSAVPERLRRYQTGCGAVMPAVRRDIHPGPLAGTADRPGDHNPGVSQVPTRCTRSRSSDEATGRTKGNCSHLQPRDRALRRAVHRLYLRWRPVRPKASGYMHR